MKTSQKLVAAFVVLIVVGAAALRLCPPPPDTARPGLVDALFTATSAVCVTGLVVRDTGREFGFAAQVIILVLIQLGGLGILTFSNLILLLVGRRIDLAQRAEVEETHGRLSMLPTSRLIGRIILYTVAFEGVGAILRFSFFLPGRPVEQAAWLALFHSVSAFCNAGFSLFSNSLQDYRQHLGVNATIMALITAGGLGFIVFADLTNWFRALRRRGNRSFKRLSLHTRTALIVSGCLVLAGATVFTFLEAFGSLQHEPFYKAVLPGLFLSVTARTAGFDTVPTAELTNVSLIVLIGLMFVGASPGSTGGGIKTTALAVLYATIMSRIRNRPDTELMDRAVPSRVVAKAMAAMVAMVASVFVGILALQLTEYGGEPHVLTRGIFLEHLFEVVSALGTVGLSTGVTPSLSHPGKLIIVACMFLGRLGPLIVADSLIGTRKRSPYTLPNESVMIG